MASSSGARAEQVVVGGWRVSTYGCPHRINTDDRDQAEAIVEMIEAGYRRGRSDALADVRVALGISGEPPRD